MPVNYPPSEVQPEENHEPALQRTPDPDPNEEAAAPADPEAQASPTPALPAADSRIYLLVYVALAVAWVLYKPAWRAFAFHWWWASLILLALIVGVLSLPLTAHIFEKLDTSGRTAVLIFIVIPTIVVVVGLIVFLSPYQFYVMRLLYLTLVILLPGVLFYLFIVNRKTSLLQEFIANLNRLGAIQINSSEPTEQERKEQLTRWLRFESYRRKFEAVYGKVSDAQLDYALGRPTVSTEGADAANEPAQQPEEKGLTTETGIPVVIATMLIALGWLLTLPLQPPANDGSNQFIQALNPQHTPIHFAFLGAYFFALQMLFRRYVLRDLRPSAYISISMRIILAVIGTSVVVEAAKALNYRLPDSALMIVGFAIGVFPPIIWQFVQAAFKKVTGARFFLPSLGSQLPISDLDGLTIWHESRLEEEGIENIPNMATADIVELLVQTRLSADQIIDWVDQAILYTCLGPVDPKQEATSPRHRLRVHGIRTATSLQLAHEKSKEGDDRESLEKILLTEAAAHTRSPMRALVDTLSTNTNLEFVRTWKGLPHKRSL